MPTTELMTIGTLSRITGMSTSAIRFYQRRGLLPKESGQGWQRFDTDTLDRLAVVALAKSAGFELDEIIRLFDAVDADPDSIPDSPAVWQDLAEAKIDEITSHIARLEKMRRLLNDSLSLGYLSADRMARVPGTLGWTAPQESDADDVHVPASPSALGHNSATS